MQNNYLNRNVVIYLKAMCRNIKNKSESHKSFAFPKWILPVIITVSLCFSSTIPLHAISTETNKTPSLITSYKQIIDIPPDSDVIIHFSVENQQFSLEENTPCTDGLSDIVKKAIIKSPSWIQRSLTRQFQALENPEPYAWLLLNASKQMTDELAFTLAASPLGDVAAVDVLSDNIFWLYEIDKQIHYADIIDYEYSDGNYYSTIQYTTLNKGIAQTNEYSKDLYYWYVVHPELLGEHAQDIYNSFWRSFLYNHNDISYPLLKEKIHTIQYLWDKESYSQTKKRIWDEWITYHPTAIEAVSYWIGKTVLYEATGDRPNQPNIIAHEHNGWCGEIQRLAVAAMRTVLIPTISVCDIGEDHVWREFYDEGWHQNDNWWTDSGGTVDIPHIYCDGWGKTMSAIYAEKGDGSIYDVTPRYIKPEDRVTVSFHVVDGFNQPYDGARVTVFVKGLKDITWYKNTLWDIINNFWMGLPDSLKDKILLNMYTRLQQRFEEIPDVIDGATVSIWNYTGVDGQCSFELGAHDEYVFLIQGSTSGFSWPLAKWNTIRVLNNPKNTTFKVKFPIFNHPSSTFHKDTISEGNYQINVTCSSSFYQVQENIRNKDIGTYSFKGSPTVFVLDKENLEKYKHGQQFNCLNYGNDPITNLSALFSDDIYIVCNNPAYQSTAHVALTLNVTGEDTRETITFVSPSTTLFDHPYFNVGDSITISGVSTVKSTLSINEKHINLPPGQWSYLWDTNGWSPGEYILQATSNGSSDELVISLIDVTPPVVFINESTNSPIVSKGDVIHGYCTDASGIQLVELTVDNDTPWQSISHTAYWSYTVDDLSMGIHLLWIKATDSVGLTSTSFVDIVINTSNTDWYPHISSVIHTPEKVSNTTNVAILANITSSRFLPIKTTMVSIESSSMKKTIPMFPYADNPVIPRHPEDPLHSESNTPVYGCELGIFPSNELVHYSISVFDVAGHVVTSEEHTFFVE